MYIVTIRTKTGEKRMEVNKLNDPNLQNELDKSYIELKIEQLKQEKDRVLSHVVGMTYNMQEVFKINKEIEQCQKKLVKESNLKESEE